MQISLLVVSGALGSFAAIAHAFLSEKVLLGPLYAEGASRILQNPRTRDIIRAVFYIPSATWLILAAALFYTSRAPEPDPLVIYIAAAVYLVSGLANFAALRRVHLGSVVLTAAAALAFAGLYA